ncbi:MAG TPA: MlaD family protein [Thermoleophilaceae bacterium]|nr:MlaD family protein [Thermoleophilaceae bacterium]
MRNRNHPQRISNFAAGLLAIVIAFCACWLAFKGAPWSNPWELRAVVSQATELGPRSPVRIAGVEVGKVKKVESGEGGTSVVTLALEDEALPIHEDATLKVRPRIFLEGNFFVDLKPGTPGAPTADEGYTLPLAQTAAPVQLDQILSTLEHDTRGNLRKLLTALGEGFADGGAQSLNEAWAPSDEAFTQGAISAEAFRGVEEDDLPEFVKSGGEVAAALARGRRLGDLVEGLNRSSRALASRRVELAATLPELDRFLAEADPALDAVNAAFPDTRALVREARPGIQAAPLTLELAIPVLAQARELVAPDELPALLDETDPAVRSLARLTPALTELLGDVTPVTECARLNALPTLQKPIEDPPNSTGEPVYRELLYGTVGLASASQNFDGNGHAVRYHAGGGENTVTTGTIPSIGEPLVGLTDEPILGSRPRFTGIRPPFRPDVPCVGQELPDLSAETGPAPQQRRISSFDTGALADVLDLLRVPGP